MAQVQEIQKPLTLMVPIKSETNYDALYRLLNDFQSLPPSENPITSALDQLGTVHFARFFFPDHGRLCLITVYDGEFGGYVNDFIDKIGAVFDAIFKHVTDAPPLPVAAHRAEFVEYLRTHDLPVVGSLYRAYPSRTVMDIRAALRTAR